MPVSRASRASGSWPTPANWWACPGATPCSGRHEVLDYVGLREERYRPVESYSTGMKQRIKLAAAIVHDPKLLILDEPTNGMDPAGREETLALARDLAHNKGINLLFSSHLLPDVEAVCDHVVVLGSGTRADARANRRVETDSSALLRSPAQGRFRLFRRAACRARMPDANARRSARGRTARGRLAANAVGNRSPRAAADPLSAAAAQHARRSFLESRGARVMPIIDQGYQHWSGELSGHAWRWLAIARHGVRVGMKESKVRHVIALAPGLPAIVLGRLPVPVGIDSSGMRQSFRPFVEILTVLRIWAAGPGRPAKVSAGVLDHLLQQVHGVRDCSWR